MRWRFAPALVAPSLLSLGCGGAAPPPSGPAPGASAPSQQGGSALVAAEPEPVPDLSPAAQPEYLFLAGRVNDPAAAFAGLGGWLGRPNDLSAVIARKAPELRDVILLDAPVEVSAALNPVSDGPRPGDPFVVVSFPVKSVAAVVAADPREWERVGPGVYRLRSGRCAAAPALGRAPARVVCELTDGGLAVLLPWATRGQPTQPAAAAPVHVELRGEPLRRLYGPQLQQARSLVVPLVLGRLSLDDPKADRLIGDTVHAVTDELLTLIEDFDQLAVDVDLPPGGERLGVTVRVGFTKDSAWSLRVLGSAQTRGSGPPETFWQLPAEADAASWHHVSDPKLLQGLQSNVSRALDLGLEKLELPASLRGHLTSLVESLLEGHDTACASGGANAVGKPPRGGAELAGWVAGAVGWRLCSVGGDAKAVKRPFETLARLLRDPALARQLDERFKLKKGLLPTFKSAPTTGFKGATTWRLSVPVAMFGEPTEKARIELVAIVAPGHGVNWVALGAAEKDLVQRLRAMQQGGPNLGSRPELAPLRQRRGFIGGFTSLAAMNDPLSTAVSDAAESESPLRNVDVALLPDKGRTPIPFELSVSREGGLAVSMSLVMPREAAAGFAHKLHRGGLDI